MRQVNRQFSKQVATSANKHLSTQSVLWFAGMVVL